MSLSETELIYLMAYVDGQVDDDELPEVTALLERSLEARQIVAQHAAMGDWIRETADAHAAEASADRIAGRVLAEIEKLGGGKVIDLERERARVALNRQRVKEFSALGLVAAMAAAFLLMPAAKESAPVAVREHAAPSSESKSPAGPTPPTSAAPPDPSPSAVALAGEGESDTADGVEVQSVDSESPVSIFYMPAVTGLNAHSSSVVVWIDE